MTSEFLHLRNEDRSILIKDHDNAWKALGRNPECVISVQYYVCPIISLCILSDSFVTPWTVSRQPPLSMGFPRREDWSGLPFPSPGHIPHPGIKPTSHTLAGEFFTAEPPGKPRMCLRPNLNRREFGKIKGTLMMQEISRVGLPWAGSVMIPHGLFDSLGSLSLPLPINISVYIFLYVSISVFIYLSSVCPVSLYT